MSRKRSCGGSITIQAHVHEPSSMSSLEKSSKCATCVHHPISSTALYSPSRHHLDKKSLRKGGMHMPRLKLRLCSLLYLVAKMKKSCGRSVLLAAAPPSSGGAAAKSHRATANSKIARGLSGSYSCSGRSSSYPDAVVDCIDYIKKSATLE